MRYEDSNLNEVIISGVINAITDTNDKYIKFGITTKKYTTKEDKNVSWGASEKTTHDFEMLEKSVEVKSTTNKTNTLISVNSSYQLSGSKPVFIYFVRLEKVKFKNSINSCVEKIVSLGIPRDALEAELSKLGYPKGVKERDDSFDLLEIRSYVVEESNFPKIDLNDLNNLIGVKNIVAYKFELDLSNVPYKKII